MKTIPFNIIFSFPFLFMTVLAQAQNNADIKFRVSFSEPQAHYADVEMIIDNIKTKEIEVRMPVWAPGSYLIREFSKNVESFKAKSRKGETLGFEKNRKNSWKINTSGNKSIIISYRVYAFEISVRTSFIDINHAFLSPTGTFMFVKGRLGEPALVEINLYKEWKKVSTGLEQVAGKPFTYYAKDFDWLYDSPIEVGNQDIFEFEASGVKHEVAMVGGGNYDKQQLKADMAKIVEEETAIYKENPNKCYVFIVHNYQKGGGGLEHLNSTVLGARRMGYQDKANYTSFMSLVAHEYFHLWNVKRLRPVALGPFDYDNENYTNDLWVAEGFTAYYDNLIVQRTGLMTPAAYLQLLQNEISLVHNQEGAKVQSVADASFNAWIKYYRPDENSANTSISYYNKGALLAAILDLKIIYQSEGKYSLDDVMRKAYQDFYKKKNRGYTTDEFKAVLEFYLNENLDSFYQDYVYGTKAFDFKKYLDYAGLKLSEKATNVAVPSIGILVKESKITRVTRNGAGWQSGLNVNDEILAVDDERVENILEYIKGRNVGETIAILISRDGLLYNIPVKIEANTDKNWQIDKLADPTPKQKMVFEKWMKL